MANLEPGEERTIPNSHPKVVQIFLDRWESLPASSPRNLPLDKAATLLGLSVAQKRLLSQAGATDLRGIARALNVVPRIERLNVRVSDAVARLSGSPRAKGKARQPRLQPARFPIAEKDSLAMREAIGRALLP